MGYCRVVFYVGAFSRPDSGPGRGSSAAGDQVQDEIFRVLGRYFEPNGVSCQAIVLSPVPSWPMGPAWVSAFRLNNVIWPAFVNVPGLKQLFFSFFLAVSLVRRRPAIIFFYNGDLFSFAISIVYKVFRPYARLVGIVQDVLTYPGCSRLKALSYSFAMRLLRYFDLIIPISRDIADDFKLQVDKVFVFRGGITRQADALLAHSIGNINARIAVFAGALESYNGVDKLVSMWPAFGDFELHVFGKGVCEGFIKDVSARNPLVVFHGVCSEDVVTTWMARAVLNFCLRYPIGIEAKYFFPSKFFNVMAAPGIAVVNRFHGLPTDAAELCVVVNDDLVDFFARIDEIPSAYNMAIGRSLRLDWLSTNADWSQALKYAIESRIGSRSV